MYKKQHTIEAKKKISIASANKTEENRKSISERTKGKNNPMYGKTDHTHRDKNLQ